MSSIALRRPPSALHLARFLAFARTELGVVVLALGVVGLHIADDNYLQPAAGTSPADHLASGLIPLAILAAVAALYPRLRAGAARGYRGDARRDRCLVRLSRRLLAARRQRVGRPLHRSRSSRRRSRLARRRPRHPLEEPQDERQPPAPLRAAGWHRRHRPRPAAVVFVVVVFPVGFAYGYTHIGHTTPPRQVDLPHERVTMTTSDGIELSAAYVPSKNGAAVVVFPGASALQGSAHDRAERIRRAARRSARPGSRAG